MGNKLIFALLLTVLTLISNGCASNKALLVAYPDYFELPAGSEMTVAIDTGYGPQPTQIKTTQEMGCYSGKAQVDALAIKKGKK